MKLFDKITDNMKLFQPGQAPRTDFDCWCIDYDREWRFSRYWHKAFCVSMFFNGMLAVPWIVAIIEALANGVPN